MPALTGLPCQEYVIELVKAALSDKRHQAGFYRILASIHFRTSGAGGQAVVRAGRLNLV